MSRLISLDNLRSGWMRTPNCKCIICEKPLYRRPNELRHVRHVACMSHRNEAQMLSGISEAQYAGLALGRRKGTNNREGYTHKESSKRKISAANHAYWLAHPDLALARGAKVRGALSPHWKGGSSRLNISIRTMTEYRTWAEAVKERDTCCLRCGTTVNLESHHLLEFAALLVEYGVKNREDARACHALWDVSNGRTLCERCHNNEHGRVHVSHGAGRRFVPKVPTPRPSMAGSANPNWKGGLVTVQCQTCGGDFLRKSSVAPKSKFCSNRCRR